MSISVFDILTLLRELISDGDKLAKFKELIKDVKELIDDIKDVIKTIKG